MTYGGHNDIYTHVAKQKINKYLNFRKTLIPDLHWIVFICVDCFIYIVTGPTSSGSYVETCPARDSGIVEFAVIKCLYKFAKNKNNKI